MRPVLPKKNLSYKLIIIYIIIFLICVIGIGFALSKTEYFEEYALGLVTDKEIQKYYDDEVFGDVDSKHILVSIAKDGEDVRKGLEKYKDEIIRKVTSNISKNKFYFFYIFIMFLTFYKIILIKF